ncbi:hypothetical protein CDAR_207341 [Caerostris darwini]|uniref:Uncharacterized protein n=1 Tax=Caerostris darwini TaxID=1538125 RepID=A0AAV4VHU7_9ARAC|nr:hypothetical protein CDAR_207341 [Caerostris darwini]
MRLFAGTTVTAADTLLHGEYVVLPYTIKLHMLYIFTLQFGVNISRMLSQSCSHLPLNGISSNELPGLKIYWTHSRMRHNTIVLVSFVQVPLIRKPRTLTTSQLQHSRTSIRDTRCYNNFKLL